MDATVPLFIIAVNEFIHPQFHEFECSTHKAIKINFVVCCTKRIMSQTNRKHGKPLEEHTYELILSLINQYISHQENDNQPVPFIKYYLS